MGYEGLKWARGVVSLSRPEKALRIISKVLGE